MRYHDRTTMNHKPGIIEALADIRTLKNKVFDRQLFCGYSGHARIAGGVIALGGALLLSRGGVPADPKAHVIVWGIVCALSGIINLIALVTWWKKQQARLALLRPVIDLAAPFLVGGLLTFSLLSHAVYDLLFPLWMSLFGLMNIASRHTLPHAMVYLGWYYISAGALCFALLPHTSFMNPLPMGVVFLIGETVGGLTFIKLRKDEK